MDLAMCHAMANGMGAGVTYTPFRQKLLGTSPVSADLFLVLSLLTLACPRQRLFFPLNPRMRRCMEKTGAGIEPLRTYRGMCYMSEKEMLVA